MDKPVTKIRRLKGPETTPEQVMEEVQTALNNCGTLDYYTASKIARSVIRSLGWCPEHDYGQGNQYMCYIRSSLGEFALFAIMPREKG
jgi:hypothetical protein